MPKRPRVYIVDESNNQIEYADAARMLGITVPTLYVKVSRFRDARGDGDEFPSDIKLSDLAVNRRIPARTYRVIDDRTTPNATNVIELTADRLTGLTGVTRNTTLRWITEYYLRYDRSLPVSLNVLINLIEHELPTRPIRSIQHEEIQLEDEYDEAPPPMTAEEEEEIKRL